MGFPTAGKPRYWTPRKNAELDRLICEGHTADEVGKIMGKTTAIIRQQARKIHRPFVKQQRRRPKHLMGE